MITFHFILNISGRCRHNTKKRKFLFEILFLLTNLQVCLEIRSSDQKLSKLAHTVSKLANDALFSKPFKFILSLSQYSSLEQYCLQKKKMSVHPFGVSQNDGSNQVTESNFSLFYWFQITQYSISMHICLKHWVYRRKRQFRQDSA